ncbi:cupin domain-containing protein [Halocatena pleomorpha]|uniref:Cupin domain-containing protein n=1 Tax=Halocatena pleomorpha TaxID=1785090 RepID=A0A3P3RK98_9EURY|nr:cupin domain-containing protein [Halocatena pleomorpha]RRJ33842.1 cupin domain-containing protein [Halocatena pleomorpha]
MEIVTIEEIETPPTNSPADVVRPLSTALDTSEIAINYFEIASGESFGYDYHRHNDQEELFYVQSGTATFETESGDVAVEAGEMIRFASGEFQLGTNRGDERVVALAIGVPRNSSEIEYLRECAQCDERTIQTVVTSEQAITIRCSECDTEVDRIP